MSGTIVYVHGASDRSHGETEHVEAIRQSLMDLGVTMTVTPTGWGHLVGPSLDGVLSAVPETRPREKGARPASRAPFRSRILQATAGAVVASAYLGLTLPKPVRVWATDRLLYRRDDLMLEILGLADVLVYQRSGDAIRARVRDVLAAVPDGGRPLIALGNSLGGIILVDALREAGAPRPDLLVTIGSQSGVLHSLGALGGDPFTPFQPWLNIYDRRDFVGFLAQPRWPQETDIRDERVDLGLGFPEVHGPAYLKARQVWDVILEHPALVSAPRRG